MEPDFSLLPESERPVNIGAVNAELIAREMSNFENAPFTLDGRRFASVEGFYVWLKWSGHAEKQALAQKLYSYEAKKFGRASTATEADYDGSVIDLGSTAHHALIARAIQAKLEQHPDLARRFAETWPRPIVHDFGYPEPPSRLPATAFTSILTALRDGLVRGTILTIEGTVAELSARARGADRALRALPVSKALVALRLDDYARAFDEFPHETSGLLHFGANCLVLALRGDRVLKIYQRPLPDRLRLRQFDLHVIERGSAQGIDWIIQPRARTPVEPEHVCEFLEEISRQKYCFAGAASQVGEYNGAVKLLDHSEVGRD